MLPFKIQWKSPKTVYCSTCTRRLDLCSNLNKMALWFVCCFFFLSQSLCLFFPLSLSSSVSFFLFPFFFCLFFLLSLFSSVSFFICLYLPLSFLLLPLSSSVPFVLSLCPAFLLHSFECMMAICPLSTK